MKIGDSTVEVGDLLRDDADGFEGVVTALNESDGTVELTMNATMVGQEVRERSVQQLHYNTWDAKYSASDKVVPTLTPTEMD